MCLLVAVCRFCGVCLCAWFPAGVNACPLSTHACLRVDDVDYVAGLCMSPTP